MKNFLKKYIMDMESVTYLYKFKLHYKRLIYINITILKYINKIRVIS
ncbi:protein of unknown function [Tepidibacter aestuarii]|nr:protein of unknown function [Tepidibacter aestuarii]